MTTNKTADQARNTQQDILNMIQDTTSHTALAAPAASRAARKAGPGAANRTACAATRTATRAAPRPAPASPLQSLAELEGFLRTADLPDRARQDMLSALNTLVRAAGKPLTVLPTDPKTLRHVLNSLSPAMAKVSDERWRNVRGLLRRALDLGQAARVLRRPRNPRSPAWAALFALLPPDSMARNRLSRLAGFCSEDGIEPEAVTTAVLDRFLEALEADPLIRRPVFMYRNAVNAWNGELDTPGWPQVRLVRQDRRNTYGVDPGLLPASLLADIEAWLDRLAGTDLTDGHDFRPLRPVTVRLRRGQVHLLVSAMVRAGVDPAALHGLADVVEPARVAKALEYVRERRGGTWTAQAEHFATVARNIARHHVMPDPEKSGPAALAEHAARVARLSSMRCKVSPPRIGMSERARERLRALDDPERMDDLLDLPTVLWDEVKGMGAPSLAGARLLRGAVALEVLIMAPIRMTNLQHLRLGEDLLPGPRGSLTIALAAVRTKNRQVFEAELPKESARLLNTYLKRYQPLLAQKPCPWLFPNEAGTGPMTDAMLRTQIVRLARLRAGVVLHPHLFRHIAVKLILDANPGAYGQAQQALGHQSVRTTETFYASADSRRAVELYGAEVLRLRGGRGRPVSGKPGSGTSGSGRTARKLRVLAQKKQGQ